MKELVVFLDIETVPVSVSYSKLPDRFKKLWGKKCDQLKLDDLEDSFDTRAGIYSEFSKVVSIALGFHFLDDLREPCLKVMSISDHNEEGLLLSFDRLLKENFSSYKVIFCAHNGKEFDYPFLGRRFLVNGIELPVELQLSGKKPWEIYHLDTMEMWKFGDFKNYTSLDTLAAVFGIESSKNGIDGSMVRDVYYEDNDLPRIAKYCAEDVIVTSQVFRRLNGLPIIPAENISVVSD